jgi:hypothetical protein
MRELRYSYNGWGSSFAFKGFTAQQSNAMIQAAYNDFSKYSGLKVLPWRKGTSVGFRVQFSDSVHYNALAVTQGNRITLSRRRPMTPAVIKTVMQHELLHVLGYKSAPSADKWGHCIHKNCIANINGTGTELCAHLLGWLRSRYGGK